MRDYKKGCIMYKLVCGLIAIAMVTGCVSESKRLKPASWEISKYGDYYLKQTPPDGPRALRLYERGAQTGDKWAQYKAAELLHSGKYGVDKDEQSAIKYYTLSSEQGNQFATLRLATFYKDGKGVDKNIGEALRLAKLAYSQSRKSNVYINMLLYDLLEKTDPVAANKYLVEAANAGDERAKSILLKRNG